MFEYNSLILRIYGFSKILHLDETLLIFKYKEKVLRVIGKGMKVSDLLDKSLSIKGVIEGIEIKYREDINDKL